MKRLAALLLVFNALAGPALAGSFSLENRVVTVYPGPNGGRVHVSPFPMSKRTASIWRSDTCWKDCTSQGAWQLEACLHTPTAGPKIDQDACRATLDAGDRACLRQCRTEGGPLLNITDY